ncbi:hypothetical protein HTV45_17305 [Streptomyces sp. CHD11]|uniref:hypothetical protein n=1 Tax=Streptomyces sp. CHD11 TaxID=2741325 RepID=UPI001BFC1CB4|nr:hypothetical protein [Streptomyces sp. CHD11]MBT3152612.1 hypothetical protein [Streptomyces sp. CHD11]
MHATTALFVETVASLSPATLADVFDHTLRLRRRGGREASRALRLSASEHSAIDHAVRSALLPRAGELDAYRAGLFSDALSLCVIGARSVAKPAMLTREQYALLTGPFTAVGVDVPDHVAG